MKNQTIEKTPMVIPDIIMFLSEEVEGYFTEEVLNEEEKFLYGESSKVPLFTLTDVKKMPTILCESVEKETKGSL
ncbi:5621_t:CDS:1, partial [Cetraspora pellucida]